jgi:hypothetical protein
MKPTQIIVITGDLNKGFRLLENLKQQRYAATLITGFGNFSKGRLFGLDEGGEKRVFQVHQYGLAFVDQVTADGFTPVERTGKRIVSLLHLIMPCVAIASSGANNEKLLRAGAAYSIDQGEELSFLKEQLPTIARRSQRPRLQKVEVDN